MLEITIQKHLDGFELDVELSAPEKQTLVLFGPSGAGKSMTLAVLAGLATPDAGRITAGGRVLFDSDRQIDLPPQERRIGLVKQDLALFPHLTVEQNIAYGLFREPAAAQRERTRALQQLLSIDGLASRYPAQLSGGQQQRVALARALAPRPELLLLDEPFNALDAPTRMQLRNELRVLQRRLETSLVFVTHDLGEAYFLADQLAVIDHGKILQIDSPGEVLRHPSCLPVARAVGVTNILPGVIVASDSAGCRVRVGDAVLQAPPHPFSVDTHVNVCLRPERIMLLRPERTGESTEENALHGEIVREMNDGMTATLYFRARDVHLTTDETRDHDLQIELPVYIYERLDLAHQRQWGVSLRRNAIHLISA